MVKIIKAAVGFVVSIGVGRIVNNAVRSTTPETNTKFMRFCIGAGSVAIASLVGDKVGKHVETKLNSFGDSVKKLVEDCDEKEVKDQVEKTSGN